MNLTQNNIMPSTGKFISTSEEVLYPEHFDNTKRIWFGVITQLIRDILSNSMKKENISIKRRAIKWVESETEMIAFISDILEIEQDLLMRYVVSSTDIKFFTNKKGRP